MMRKLSIGGALLLALAAFGCGNNGGSPIGYVPEGQPNSSLLLIDVQPLSAADSTTIVAEGLIFDASPTDGFRLYVDPANTGFRPAADYVSSPTKTYSTGYSLYQIRANAPDLSGPNDYIARGARHGIESAAAPLTNHAITPGPVPAIDLARRLDMTLLAPADSAAVDSLPTLSWAPVTGASGYLVRIIGRNGVVYLVHTTATSHRVEIDPGLRLEVMPMRSGLFYRWDVQAIDGGHRIFARTAVPRALLVR
ncbi:MAG: hypothetical protein ABI960_08350 [Candidatus Eisenbacteria bacterium]